MCVLTYNIMNLYSFKLIDWKSACWFYSFRIVRKRKSPKRWSLRAFLLDYQDSNLDKQNQNLLCYHYTIVQTLGAFLRKRGKDTIFLKYAPNISLFFCDMNRPFALWSGKNQFWTCLLQEKIFTLHITFFCKFNFKFKLPWVVLFLAIKILFICLAMYFSLDVLLPVLPK